MSTALTIPQTTRPKPVVPSDTTNNIVYAQFLRNEGSSAGEFWVRHRYKEAVEAGTQEHGPGVMVANRYTTPVGTAFTNQPANDAVEIISAEAADTTQTVTIIGTTTATNTVVSEDLALNGTTVATTTKTDWGLILGVKMDAVATGVVTIREASANATITTLAVGATSAGVYTVTNPGVDPVLPVVFASGATTKQIGIKGTDSAGSVIYASLPLTGATEATIATTFYTVTEIYIGDLESTVTATLIGGAAVVMYLERGGATELATSALGVNSTGMTAGVELVAYY